jgi:peptidyl-prolyl cis-trans isomerase D
MITEIRKSLKGPGFKAVLWLTLLSMVVVFIPNIFKRGGEGYHATIATINGTDIEFVDFERRVYQETERINIFRQQLGQQADAILQALGLSDPKTMALNGLIQDTLLNNVARTLNIQVSPEFIIQKLNDPSYVAEELSDIVPFYIIDQQGINMPMLNRYLSLHRLTMKDFENQIEEKIKRNTVLSIIEAAAYVSQQQIKDYFIHNYLGKEYTVVTFPFDAYIKKAKVTPLTDQEISSYFEKEHKRYWTPEKRSGTQWKFSPQDYGIVVTDKDNEAYYNAHKSQFIESPLQVQVRRILFRVKDDEKSIQEAQEKAKKVKQELSEHPHNFERLAREHSQDKLSAPQGGLSEFFKKGEKDPEFERAAFRLQNDGDISDIIPTQDGFEIIQRVARKPAVYKPLSSVAPEIKNMLYLQKFKTQFTDDVSKLLSKNNKEQVSSAMNEFIKAKKGVLEKIENMSNNGSPLAEKIFKLKEGDWTSLISDNKGVVATVTSIQKSHRPELASVKKQIEQDLYNDKAAELIQKDLNEAKGQNSGTLKEKYPAVTIKKTGMVNKDDKEKLNDFAQEGIPVSVFDQLDKEGAETTLTHQGSGYLIKVNKAEAFNQEQFESNKNIISTLLYDEQKKIVQKGFIASLYRNATINLTKSLLNIKDENTL